MVIYEVNLEVNTGIHVDYEHWLKEHVGQMLKLPGFLSAKVYSRALVDAEARKDRRFYTVLYEVNSSRDLQDYFEGPAKVMRQESIDRFGTRFSAERQILYPLF